MNDEALTKNSTLVAANPIEVAARQEFSTVLITVPTGLPAYCTFRPTATVTATTGCPTTCTNAGLCFADGTYNMTSGPQGKDTSWPPRANVEDGLQADTIFFYLVNSGCDVGMRLPEHGGVAHHDDCLSYRDGMQELPDRVGNRHGDADQLP